MVELNFSIYGDQPSVLEGNFLDEFRTSRHTKVNVNRLAWSEAWPKMLDYAIHGGGPDISHIGAIWTGSLVAMNVLRAINQREIQELGGEDRFYVSAWQNTLAAGSNKYWAVPFTTYAYSLVYRRDLLQKAGVNEEQAFVSHEAMSDTINRLKAANISSPIVLPSGSPFRGRLHCAASWIWGAGGEFVDEQNVLIDQTEARTGLVEFFELYRHLNADDYGVGYDECVQRVLDGQAAIAFTGVRNWSDLPQPVSEYGNIGSAPLPGIPWVGGSNLVIWSEIQSDISLDRAALELANYLTSQQVQINYCNAIGTMPARSDVIEHIKLPIASLAQTLDITMRTGRAYKPTVIWVRMLNELSRTFDRITAEILKQPEKDIRTILERPIAHLANRFRLMINQ